MYTFQYRFQGSSEVRTLSANTTTMSGSDLCERILSEFGSSCTLSVDVEELSYKDVVEVKREYGKKFDKPMKPKTKPKVKRRKRWSSPVRRWRSRSPISYNRVYTTNNY
jgi:hypothetical protein